MTPIETEARRALGVADRFWRAVSRDESAAAGRLMSSAWPEANRNDPGLAAAYREARELRPETMALEGIMSHVEVLAADRLRFLFTLIGTGTYEAGVPIVVTRLELVLEDGEWLVDRSSDLPLVATVTLALPEDPFRAPQPPPSQLVN
jgi:hypothetical protein